MADIALNVWSILSMLTQPTQLDEANQILNERKIMNAILDPARYDKSVPGSYPLKATPVFFITHIEQLDEKQQSMTVHGGVHMTWTDPRLVWNISDYQNVRELSRARNYLRMKMREPFVPKIHATEMYSKSSDLARLDSTQMTIRYDGTVTARFLVQIVTTCLFKFDEFPNDEQTCAFSLYSPTTIDKFMFGTYSQLVKFWRRLEMSWVYNSITVDDFALKKIENRLLYKIPGATVVQNPKQFPERMVRSVLRISLIFQRQNRYFVVQMALPLFCIATATYMIALLNTPHSPVLLLLMACIQIVNALSLVPNLPPDYESMPRIAFLATLIFLETFFLILYRFFTLKRLQDFQGKIDPVVSRTELILRICIPVLIIYNYYQLL